MDPLLHSKNKCNKIALATIQSRTYVLKWYELPTNISQTRQFDIFSLNR